MPVSPVACDMRTHRMNYVRHQQQVFVGLFFWLLVFFLSAGYGTVAIWPSEMRRTNGKPFSWVSHHKHWKKNCISLPLLGHSRSTSEMVVVVAGFHKFRMRKAFGRLRHPSQSAVSASLISPFMNANANVFRTSIKYKMTLILYRYHCY